MCSHNTWKLQVKQIHVQKSNLSCELIWFLSSQSKTKSNRRVIKIMMQSRKWEKVKRDAQITMYNYKYKATNAECDTAWKRADNNSTRTSKIGSEFQPGGRKSGHVTFESMIIHQSQSFPHTTWLSQDSHKTSRGTWYVMVTRSRKCQGQVSWADAWSDTQSAGLVNHAVLVSVSHELKDMGSFIE